MEGGGLPVRPRAGNRDTICLHLSPGNFLMPRSGLYPIKSLVRTQVIQKQTSNSRASGFHPKSPWGFWVGCSNPGRIRGRPLTLSTNRPLPAFFADTGEGVSIDHAGASVMTGVRQAATVSSYITGCSFPATRTHALKRIHFIIAGATVITRGFVTLAVT